VAATVRQVESAVRRGYAMFSTGCMVVDRPIAASDPALSTD